jgi:CubicO group peptidase (beta-lactamase class C family)
MWRIVVIFGILLQLGCSHSNDDNNNASNFEIMYFPPNNNSVWETIAPSELDWDESKIPDLLTYLQNENTKSLIVLYNGRIVIEEYFNNHTATTPWYWASAGKTLTATLTGIAEQEGFLNIQNKVSDYIGTNWTSIPIEKEGLITCRHLLNMTAGLDDSQGDNVSPSNLQYSADAGTRWAYHNVYVKLQDIVATATNQSWEDYFTLKLKNPIGMTGNWYQFEDLSIYWSDSRSMARFGLLALNKGSWNNTTIVNQTYFNASTSTSQNINLAYGYLWWLNGKTSFHIPQSQLEYPGSLIPNAPDDTFMALGKNDQKIYVVPSRNLVIIRMGDAAEGNNIDSENFNNTLWQYINAVIN